MREKEEQLETRTRSRMSWRVRKRWNRGAQESTEKTEQQRVAESRRDQQQTEEERRKREER